MSIRGDGIRIASQLANFPRQRVCGADGRRHVDSGPEALAMDVDRAAGRLFPDTYFSCAFARFHDLDSAGKVVGSFLAATVGIMALTSAALVAFTAIAKPDLGSYHAALPFDRFGGVITGGVIFTVVNATLEELVFRGVLFDAIRSQWNVWVTLIATSVLFGLGHLHGYPPGLSGACLAVVFGFAVGVLRVWTDGLALPIVAHMGADATIYWILVSGGVA